MDAVDANVFCCLRLSKAAGLAAAAANPNEPAVSSNADAGASADDGACTDAVAASNDGVVVVANAPNAYDDVALVTAGAPNLIFLQYFSLFH